LESNPKVVDVPNYHRNREDKLGASKVLADVSGGELKSTYECK